MAPFSLQIHIFIGSVADPGVAIAILALVAIGQDGQSLKLVEPLLFYVFKSCSNFLIDYCVEVFAFIGQGLTRLVLTTVEMYFLALTGSALPFTVCASFALIDGDPKLFHGVVAMLM
eukprot:7009813-Ditylum_brightwellii.AAC.1